jgi:hypothetical protein
MRRDHLPRCRRVRRSEAIPMLVCRGKTRDRHKPMFGWRFRRGLALGLDSPSCGLGPTLLGGTAHPRNWNRTTENGVGYQRQGFSGARQGNQQCSHFFYNFPQTLSTARAFSTASRTPIGRTGNTSSARNRSRGGWLEWPMLKADGRTAFFSRFNVLGEAIGRPADGRFHPGGRQQPITVAKDDRLTKPRTSAASN